MRKIQSSQRNLRYAGFRARANRARFSRRSLGIRAEAQGDPIKLRRVRVDGDDPLIGDIHVSQAESAERQPAKWHKSIRGRESRRRRAIVRPFAR